MREKRETGLRRGPQRCAAAGRAWTVALIVVLAVLLVVGGTVTGILAARSSRNASRRRYLMPESAVQTGIPEAIEAPEETGAPEPTLSPEELEEQARQARLAELEAELGSSEYLTSDAASAYLTEVRGLRTRCGMATSTEFGFFGGFLMERDDGVPDLMVGFSGRGERTGYLVRYRYDGGLGATVLATDQWTQNTHRYDLYHLPGDTRLVPDWDGAQGEADAYTALYDGQQFCFCNGEDLVELLTLALQSAAPGGTAADPPEGSVLDDPDDPFALLSRSLPEGARTALFDADHNGSQDLLVIWNDVEGVIHGLVYSYEGGDTVCIFDSERLSVPFVKFTRDYWYSQEYLGFYYDTHTLSNADLNRLESYNYVSNALQRENGWLVVVHNYTLIVMPGNEFNFTRSFHTYDGEVVGVSVYGDRPAPGMPMSGSFTVLQ